MALRIEGRDPESASAQMETDASPFRKVATVLAKPITEDVIIVTPEGNMEASAGDYLVSDDPPTHLWPVRKAIFESTYEILPERRDTESFL